MKFKFFLLLCIAASSVPGHCGEKKSNDEERSRLPEFLSELDVASAEASLEDVAALSKLVKRLAPSKNGEYMWSKVFFGNMDHFKRWLKGPEITGQPGVDYPALTSIPATSFSCRGQKGGYYADLETNCQVFHICDNGRKISFLCPNGTIFQQSQLICDWWFKVDCSKSVELYEQSAEFLAEEERKRIENKKMNSEFHRSNNNDNNEQRYYQNGRMNPYGQSAIQNQLPNAQNSKYDSNQIYQRQSNKYVNQATVSSNQYTQDSTIVRAKDDYNKPNNDRQQNQLTSHDGKINQANNYDQKSSNKYYGNQLKSNQEDDYYGSAANVNTQREDKKNIKSSTKPRTFTRQNFNNPIQKVTPLYTETTTFRTSTANPIHEFQQLAESSAFAFSRGNRYRFNNSNQFNNFYSNNKDTLQQQSTTSKIINSSKDRNNPHPFIRPRVAIPAFPGPTFSPIFKPRTTTLSVRDPSITTLRGFTDYDKQDFQSTTYANYETTTIYPEYSSTELPFMQVANVYRNNANELTTTLRGEGFTTVLPTTQKFYYARDTYKETMSPSATTTYKYDSEESVTHFGDNYSGSFTTLMPTIYKNNYSQNTVSSNNVDDNSATTEAENYVKNIEKFESSKYPIKNALKGQSQIYKQNVISMTSEKPNRGNIEMSVTRRTPSPYDTSVTYQRGKIMSTLGPYIPFTKNYAFSTSSTTVKPNYSLPNVYYNQISKNLLSNSKQNFISSNFGKSGTRATYLPEKTTQPAYITEKNNLIKRPLNEREHALDMIKSLQGLEGNLPNSNFINNRTGLEIPSSSGPSTLHSLALYFANSDNYLDNIKPTDFFTNAQYFETTLNPLEKNNSVIELPSNILTQHTISSYAELFNLNNALENNITGDTNYDINEENSPDEDISDLDIQQSEGPLSGVRKSNNTKLRELAQVFTQALSAYLQDPDTFKRVLTEIRPTEPPQISENEITTTSPITTEDYPSVTKEKDEVLDFSDDINGIRKRRPITTSVSETIRESIDSGRETTYPTFSTSEYFVTTTIYPDESLNEAQSGYIHNSENNIAYQDSEVFDSKKLNEVKNYKSTNYESNTSSESGKYYENYFPNDPHKYSNIQNNSTNTYSPYGKFVKPSNATPISDNYVASSTPATYEVAAPQIFVPNKSGSQINDKLYEKIRPSINSNLGSLNSINSILHEDLTGKVSDNKVTPIYKKTHESKSSTREPFRIRYYDTTTPKLQQSESLVTASSIHSNYENNYNVLNNKTEKAISKQKNNNQQPSNHWTSSPSVTQLWETTVFINPEQINRGLDTDPRINQPSSIDYRSTTSSQKNVLQSNEDYNVVTPHNFFNNPSTPWEWASNNDSPTAFSLLPNIYSNTENTATASSHHTTKSIVTTKIISSTSSSNGISSNDDNLSKRIKAYDVSENEILKAQQMFGTLNETSSNMLMKVMKQADNNTTVRQLVLLLISHCNGPMNKTMEEEKEQLLNALLKMPVNEFTTEESRELIRGISTLQLPIGKPTSETNSVKTTTSIVTTTITPSLGEPSVTTFRSRSGRKFKTPTEKSYNKVTNNNSQKYEKIAASESRGTVALEEETISDNRALDLLRSLYTIAAKWG